MPVSHCFGVIKESRVQRTAEGVGIAVYARIGANQAVPSINVERHRTRGGTDANLNKAVNLFCIEEPFLFTPGIILEVKLVISYLAAFLLDAFLIALLFLENGHAWDNLGDDGT
jgi:hypothetical protein